ncbi:hypothetical protein BET03_03490 [Thermohalobacter berrensis]|uniref:ABC transmembrane type-2 domain-containing protein n=2 Tax=Thermohalobacter berrensis TaxID=99594 RepID=A0A419T176_9FIRM|nr:hypothetical protein BET03_03490 [Thermohalobacter berrensis]
MMIAMTLVFSTVFGFTLSQGHSPKILIVDKDKTEYSQILIDELSKDEIFEYEFANYEDAVKMVDENKALSAVIIEDDFSEKIKNGKKTTLNILKVKENRELMIFENLLSKTTAKIAGNINIAEIITNYITENGSEDKIEIFNKAYTRMSKGLKYRRPLMIEKEIFNSSNNRYDNYKHLVIGLMLFFSMYTMVFGIGEILNERKYNTWQRQLVSPLSKFSILLGNMVYTLIIGMVQISILILFSKYIFRVEWGSSIGGILLVAFGFTFSVTSLGLLLSGIVKTHGQLSAITPVVLTSTSMLGGCMWPLEIVNSKILLALANITPQKWAIEGMERIAMYGQGFESVLFPTLVLFMMGIIFLGVGTKLVKFE